MKVTECGYCDCSLSPKNVDGDLICSNCGAEWADAKCERELTKEEIQFLQNAIYREYDF